MKIYAGSAAALSWIDQLTGVPEVDVVAPGTATTRGKITGNAGYRFASFLDVSVEQNEATATITRHTILPQTGIYRAPSYLHVPSWKFPVDTNVTTGHEPITFMQITGARTITPEVVGTSGGAVTGAAAGAGIGVWAFGRGAPPGAATGSDYYDAVSNLKRWIVEGWGPIRTNSASGPTPGNPWDDLKGIL